MGSGVLIEFDSLFFRQANNLLNDICQFSSGVVEDWAIKFILILCFYKGLHVGNIREYRLGNLYTVEFTWLAVMEPGKSKIKGLF